MLGSRLNRNKPERAKALPPEKYAIIEEEMREEAELFQQIVEKPLILQRRRDEARRAKEERDRQISEEIMMEEMKKKAHWMDVESHIEETMISGQAGSRFNSRGGVSKRLTVLKKMAAKASRGKDGKK